MNVTILLTKTENGVTYTQEYFMILKRIEQLAGVSFSLKNGDLQLYNTDGSTTAVFDRDVTSYTVKVQKNEESVSLSGRVPFSVTDNNPFFGGFLVDIDGEAVDIIG